jgi:hypothetical protein
LTKPVLISNIISGTQFLAPAGFSGTIVEIYEPSSGSPGFEVEFVDKTGDTLALATLSLRDMANAEIVYGASQQMKVCETPFHEQ